MSDRERASCKSALRSPLCRTAEIVATLVRLAPVRVGGPLLVERDLERRLTCCWVLSLVLVGLVATATTAIAVLMAAEQRAHGAIVSEASSQRARAQRIAAFLPELAGDDPVEVELARLELARIADRMEAVFRSLAAGEGAPALQTESLRAHYFDGPLALAPRLARFLAELQALVRDVDEGLLVSRAALDALRREALGPLLGLLDEAVNLHEAYLRRDVEHLVRASLLCGGVVVLLLVAIGFGIFRPMTRGLAALVSDLTRLADRDPLTDLLNRRALVAALDRAIAAGSRLATIAIDLDHFKEANERAGHAGGDALLRAAGARLRAVVRAQDIVGRIGGDEFVVFLLGIEGEAELRSIVERLRIVLHEPVEVDGRLLPMGATLGVAVCPEDADDAETLLRLADDALVRAKQERRGTVRRASREDAEQLHVAREVRLMLDRLAGDGRPEGLGTVFQPIVALDGRAPAPILGMEALARWTHPRLGPVAPDRLFAAAPDRASAVRLGRLVRRSALAEFAALRAEASAGLRLAVNLAPAEVFDEGFADSLLVDLGATGTSPADLCLEITEEVLLERVSDRALAGLVALRARGACLALDDFGTGTSGLAQLLRLPIDVVKVDRRFVRELDREHKAREIVRATIALARSLGLRVVAEGVETAEQARILTELGCSYAQGHFFARPMDLDRLRAWLATGGHRARPSLRPPREPAPAAAGAAVLG